MPTSEEQARKAHEILDDRTAQVRRHTARIEKEITHLRSLAEYRLRFLNLLTKDLDGIRRSRAFTADPSNHIEAKIDWLELRLKGISDWNILWELVGIRLNKEADPVMKSVHECAAHMKAFDPPDRLGFEFKNEDKGPGNKWHLNTLEPAQRLDDAATVWVNASHVDVEMETAARQIEPARVAPVQEPEATQESALPSKRNKHQQVARPSTALPRIQPLNVDAATKQQPARPSSSSRIPHRLTRSTATPTKDLTEETTNSMTPAEAVKTRSRNASRRTSLKLNEAVETPERESGPKRRGEKS